METIRIVFFIWIMNKIMLGKDREEQLQIQKLKINDIVN
jgi:hypothetical protein